MLLALSPALFYQGFLFEAPPRFTAVSYSWLGGISSFGVEAKFENRVFSYNSLSYSATDFAYLLKFATVTGLKTKFLTLCPVIEVEFLKVICDDPYVRQKPFAFYFTPGFSATVRRGILCLNLRYTFTQLFSHSVFSGVSVKLSGWRFVVAALYKNRVSPFVFVCRTGKRINLRVGLSDDSVFSVASVKYPKYLWWGVSSRIIFEFGPRISLWIAYLF